MLTASYFHHFISLLVRIRKNDGCIRPFRYLNMKLELMTR